MFFDLILIFLLIISIANGTFKRKLETIVEEEDLLEEEPLFKKINNSEKNKITKRALVISTNFDSNNFKMNTILANLLTKHFFVHYLIINTKEDDFKFEYENFSTILNKNSIEINEEKNTFEIFNLSPKLKKDFSNYEFSKYYLGGGNIQEEKIKNQIERESFDIFREIFYLGRNIINRSKNFNLGLFDSNNIGALFIFHAAGIKNVFCINNTPLKTYQFKYAGKEFPKNIPANLGKSKLKEILEHKQKQKGIDDHIKNEELYEILHEKMDSYFKFRFSIAKIDENTPSLKNLYSNIKAIFLNNDELTDFPLGDSKPENLFYVGGIHLIGLKEIKNKLKFKKEKEQIIISKETCKLFNDLRGLEVWNSLREVLRSFKDKFSFLYDCNKDQLINWRINKIGSETFKDIPNIYEELAKGDTKLLISTCNNYQVIEAFAFNVGIICIPYNENQFYIARALYIDHPELENIKIGNKSTEYFKNLFNRMGTYLKGNTSSQVSPRRSQTENNKEILNKNILVKIIIYYEEKFDVKKLFRIGLGKILENDNYTKTVEKASIYLHEKWEKQNPQNVFINKVLENLEN